jgi:F-box protein 11
MKAKPSAFLSYAHVDYQFTGGRVSTLCSSLSREVQLLTGDEFKIFKDSDIEWGENWRQRIKESLNAVTFLIPILTPSFFNREECRKEVEQFLQREEQLKRNDLVLPIYFIECSLLENEASRANNKLAQVIATHQFRDLRSLRDVATDSEAFQKAVRELAQNICKALVRTTFEPPDEDKTPDKRPSDTVEPIPLIRPDTSVDTTNAHR